MRGVKRCVLMHAHLVSGGEEARRVPLRGSPEMADRLLARYS